MVWTLLLYSRKNGLHQRFLYCIYYPLFHNTFPCITLHRPIHHCVTLYPLVMLCYLFTPYTFQYHPAIYPYTALYLPTPPSNTLYLPMQPCITLYPPILSPHFSNILPFITLHNLSFPVSPYTSLNHPVSPVLHWITQYPYIFPLSPYSPLYFPISPYSPPKFTIPCVSCVTYPVSCVTCHMSHVRCHVYFCFVKLNIYIYIHTFIYTRRYSPLRGLTSSSCGGLRPTAEAFFSGKTIAFLSCFCLFYAIFGNF